MSSISAVGTAIPVTRTGGAGVDGRRLEGLQALRGLAAMMVVLLHAAQMAGMFNAETTLHLVISRFSAIGYFGVDIFFVLSGVVISILLRRNEARPEAPGGFLLRRATKLLPTFWITLGVMLLLPPEPEADNSIGQFLAQPLSLLLLAPQSAQPVGWTLVYEAHFYIVAALALCFGPRAGAAMLGWVALQAVAVGLASAGLLPKLAFFGPMSLELCAGLLIGRLAPQLPMRAPGIVAPAVLGGMLGAALTLPIYGLTLQEGMRLVICGLPAMVLVYAVLSLDGRGWRPPQVALWLGDISYSLYMWHLAVLIGLATALKGLGLWPLPLPYWALGLVLSVLVSWAAYRFIEAPAVRWGNRLTRRRDA